MPKASRILLCDHRGDGLTGLQALLERAGHTPTSTASLRASIEALAGGLPEVLVLDPLIEGGERELVELEAAARTATTRSTDDDASTVAARLLVAGPDGWPIALETMRRAGTPLFDVVRRDAPREELLLRVERLVQAAREKERMLELEHKASHDDRTDLLRPDAFQRRLAETFSAAQRHRLEFALVILDLDDFGRVNKTWDHTIGDLVIAKVGEVVRRNLRHEDVAGRLGGDEFAVLLPYTGRIEAAHAVKRLRDEIAKLSPLLGARVRGLSVSASFGFETCDGKDLDDAETLRLHAEIALREAKRLGGGQAIYFRSLAARAKTP